MALNFNDVNIIDIPEGGVKEISINGTTVWKAKYVWTNLHIVDIESSRTMTSRGSNINGAQIATVPRDAIKIRITLSYSQTPNSHSYYETNIDTLSIDTVENSLSSMPTTITIPLDRHFPYLFAVRYRTYREESEYYMRYWYLNFLNTTYSDLILHRTQTDDVAPTSITGLYPITITKVEALIPNPD